MFFSEKDVVNISHLARIEINPTESPTYVSQLNKIFELVEQMKDIDTTHIEPMTHPQDIELRLREDIVANNNQRQLYQSIAPATENGLYLVPQVIGRD